MFWLNVVLGVGVLLACLVLLNESRKEGADRRIDVPGALFSIAMFFFLVLGLIKGQEWGWTAGKTLCSFAAAIGGLILFVLTEARLMARGREPLMNLTPFRNATFNVAIFATIVVNAGFAGFLFLLALLLQGPLGYDALGSGLRYVPLMVGFLFVSPVVSRFEPRLNPRLLYGVGFGLFAVGTLLLTRLTARDDWNVLIPGLLIAGVGCAIAQIETILGAVAAVPLSLTTMASGTSAAFRQVGSSIGVALFGSILTSRYIAALPHALQAANVPTSTRGGILQGNGVPVNAAGRLLPGLPAQVARAVQDGTHHAFVAAFHDAAVVASSILAATMIVSVLMAKRAAPVEITVPVPQPLADLEQQLA